MDMLLIIGCWFFTLSVFLSLSVCVLICAQRFYASQATAITHVLIVLVHLHSVEKNTLKFPKMTHTTMKKKKKRRQNRLSEINSMYTLQETKCLCKFELSDSFCIMYIDDGTAC